MSLKDRAKATAKNIEGKVQEAVGDLTGDPKAQAEGKEKQAEAKIRPRKDLDRRYSSSMYRRSILELKQMISLQQIRRFFVTIILTIMLAITIAFDFGTTDSWAATLPTQLISQPQTQIATMNRAKAVTKDIEGKVQEAIGNITGDPKDQMMGKAKQVESQARNAAEDIKDQMKLKGRAKAVTKNIEGKVQEAKGKATGNRQDQVAGKAKQVESQVRNAVEDVKGQIQDILN